jgi:hypothetical protein
LAVTTFSDPVSQECLGRSPGQWSIVTGRIGTIALEVAYKPGVTNPLGITARERSPQCFGQPSRRVP